MNEYKINRINRKQNINEQIENKIEYKRSGKNKNVNNVNK